jgi:hypothetical protein
LRLVYGTFFDVHGANEAVDRLMSIGYPRDYISVIMSVDTRESHFGESEGEERASKVARGAAGGGVIGGAMGAIVAAFTLTGAIGVTAATGGAAAPFVAGPLAAALAGGGAGAAAGGILGAIIGLGLPSEHAESIERDIASGAIVVVVDARDEDIAEVQEILRGGSTESSSVPPSEAAPEISPVRQAV